MSPCHDKNCDDKINTIEERLENKLNSFSEALNRIEHLLTGNGTPERGILIRIDRLEQRAFDQQKRTGYAVAAACAAFAGIVVQITVYFINNKQ